MNITYINEVYKYLKEYLQTSEYDPRVTQKSLKQSDKFPLVTIISENNVPTLTTTNFEDSTDKISFTIDIYAQDMAVGNATISNVNVVNKLSEMVDNVMFKHFKMQRTLCEPTPNLDNSIYRVTIKYNKKLITSKNLFI